MHDNSPIISIIILLLLFVGLPALLKRLGRQTYSGRDVERPDEHEQQTVHDDRMSEYPQEPTLRHDYEHPGKGAISSKPIHPKWF